MPAVGAEEASGAHQRAPATLVPSGANFCAGSGPVPGRARCRSDGLSTITTFCLTPNRHTLTSIDQAIAVRKQVHLKINFLLGGGQMWDNGRELGIEPERGFFFPPRSLLGHCVHG